MLLRHRRYHLKNRSKNMSSTKDKTAIVAGFVDHALDVTAARLRSIRASNRSNSRNPAMSTSTINTGSRTKDQTGFVIMGTSKSVSSIA